ESGIECLEDLSKEGHLNASLHGTNEGSVESANRTGDREEEVARRVSPLGTAYVGEPPKRATCGFYPLILQAQKPLAVADGARIAQGWRRSNHVAGVVDDINGSRSWKTSHKAP